MTNQDQLKADQNLLDAWELMKPEREAVVLTSMVEKLLEAQKRVAIAEERERIRPIYHQLSAGAHPKKLVFKVHEEILNSNN